MGLRMEYPVPKKTSLYPGGYAVDTIVTHRFYHEFEGMHVFVNWKWFQSFDLDKMKKNHHVHIYVSNRMDMDDDFISFAIAAKGRTGKKVIIHLPKESDSRLKCYIANRMARTPRLKNFIKVVGMKSYYPEMFTYSSYNIHNNASYLWIAYDPESQIFLNDVAGSMDLIKDWCHSIKMTNKRRVTK